MMQDGMRRQRRQLSAEEKRELFLDVTSQQLTQADAARKWNVDVSVVIRDSGAQAGLCVPRAGCQVEFDDDAIDQG